MQLNLLRHICHDCTVHLISTVDGTQGQRALVLQHCVAMHTAPVDTHGPCRITTGSLVSDTMYTGEQGTIISFLHVHIQTVQCVTFLMGLLLSSSSVTSGTCLLVIVM